VLRFKGLSRRQAVFRGARGGRYRDAAAAIDEQLHEPGRPRHLSYTEEAELHPRIRELSVRGASWADMMTTAFWHSFVISSAAKP